MHVPNNISLDPDELSAICKAFDAAWEIARLGYDANDPISTDAGCVADDGCFPITPSKESVAKSHEELADRAGKRLGIKPGETQARLVMLQCTIISKP